MRKIIVNANKISLVVSFLALTASIIAICVSVKNNNQVVELSQSNKIERSHTYNDNNKVIINDIPDTTIIKKDGSRVEVKSYKANDNLNGIIVENEDVSNGISENRRKISNKSGIISKENKPSNINKEEKYSPKETKSYVSTQKKLSQEGVISGKYVIQTGAFKVRQQAQRQCEKIRKSVKLQDKQCQYVFKNNQYRVIIFPFENKNSADEFAGILSRKNFPVLTKKNI